MSTDVIVVDPPRAGCEKAALENFAHMTQNASSTYPAIQSLLAKDSEFDYVAKEIQSSICLVRQVMWNVCGVDGEKVVIKLYRSK